MKTCKKPELEIATLNINTTTNNIIAPIKKL